MESENIIYFIQFVRNNLSSSFKDRETCNRYIEQNLARTVTMMDKYTAEHNPWWLKMDANMAYHQLIELDCMIVEYHIFMDTLSRLLNRPLSSVDMYKNYDSVVEEARLAYTNHMQKQIMDKYVKTKDKPQEIEQSL